MSLPRKFCIAALTVAALAIPSMAQARIVPLERAYPFGQTSYEYASGIPLSGLTSNLVRPYPWARVTIAYNTANGNVLEGCRGNGVATVRVWTWTKGAGWDLTTCIGREPWRVVLRGIGPAVHVEAYVTFR